MRKLTNKEIDFLKSLMNDKELGYKKLLNSFILRNTTEPTYKIGDYVIFCEYDSHIYGNQVINFKGKITKISYLMMPICEGNECIQYEIIAKDQNGEQFNCIAEEYLSGKKGNRFIVKKTNTDINQIERKNKYSQSSSL